VTYPHQPPARARFTPAIFPLAEFTTPQDYQPHRLVPSLAASTMAHSRGGTGNKNLNFKLGHYKVDSTFQSNLTAKCVMIIK
jgi:hypothetical protein